MKAIEEQSPWIYNGKVVAQFQKLRTRVDQIDLGDLVEVEQDVADFVIMAHLKSYFSEVDEC